MAFKVGRPIYLTRVADECDNQSAFFSPGSALTMAFRVHARRAAVRSSGGLAPPGGAFSERPSVRARRSLRYSELHRLRLPGVDPMRGVHQLDRHLVLARRHA